MRNAVKSTNVKAWQNLDVVCIISKEFALDDTVWSSKESMPNQANIARKKAADLKSYVEHALDSTPFRIEIIKKTRNGLVYNICRSRAV